MSVSLYNTLTKKIDAFEPNEKMRSYVCGPTVYDYIHIGNARTMVFFDSLIKHLRFRGFEVDYLMNITDLDDKIIARAHEVGRDPLAYAKEYAEYFIHDMETLGVKPDNYLYATEYIEEIKSQVQRLLDSNHAYVIDGDGVYFDLTTFAEYGKLSGRTATMADDGVSRIDDSPNKRNTGDFAIWKFSKTDEPAWDADFGAGRPGWHIEDTAMTEKHFGPQYELHGAGIDLLFPHHEAELTIMESLSGKVPFVKHWAHVGFLVNSGKRMGKSNANFMTLHEALEKYSPAALRFYFLSAHYRSQLDFTPENLAASEAGVQRIAEITHKLKTFDFPADGETIDLDTTKEAFWGALDDDMNTPRALGTLFDLIKTTNPLIAERKLSKSSADAFVSFLNDINAVLGIVLADMPALPDEIESLIQERESARQAKEYTRADELRSQIQAKGFSIDDTPYGPSVKSLISLNN